jgi:hypothetical protein
MIFIHGSRLYGKVDQVPGLFYVATMFFHVQFVPLVPYQSFVLLDLPKTGGQGRGARIRLSGKSILFAWLRTACLVAGIALAVGTLVAAVELLQGHPGQRYEPLVLLACLAAACFGVFWASYRLSRPRVPRALRLAGQAGITPEVLAQHLAHRLTDAEIEKLERLAQEQLVNESSSVEA